MCTLLCYRKYVLKTGDEHIFYKIKYLIRNSNSATRLYKLCLTQNQLNFFQFYYYNIFKNSSYNVLPSTIIDHCFVSTDTKCINNKYFISLSVFSTVYVRIKNYFPITTVGRALKQMFSDVSCTQH